MPVNLQDGGLVLLDVLGDPPVIVLLKVANGDAFRSTTNGKLVLLRRPLHVSSGTVNTKDYEGGLPSIVLEGPHVSVTILRARHNTV